MLRAATALVLRIGETAATLGRHLLSHTDGFVREPSVAGTKSVVMYDPVVHVRLYATHSIVRT